MGTVEDLLRTIQDFAYDVRPGVSALPLMITAGLVGLLIRTALSSVGQRWVATYHHTMTYILLPVTAFVITRVIAGNISLSLGMIDALSIVRFRNPVRNPFELVTFFALVTIGVAISAEPSLGIALGVFIVLVIYGVALYEKFASKNHHRPFSISFAEGEAVHTLLIQSSGRIQSLDEAETLTQLLEDRSSNECSYVLNFRTRAELDETARSLEVLGPTVLSLEMRIGQSAS